MTSAVTINTTARSLTVNTSDVTKASATQYVYTVTVKTPLGAAITMSTPYTIKLLVSTNSACEPPATTTPTTTAAQTFTIGASLNNLVFLWTAWTYTTSPSDSTCTLSYTPVVPTSLSSVLACVGTTRTCTLTNASVTEAMTGVYSVSVTGLTPTGTAIASLSSTVSLTILSQCTLLTAVTAPTTATQTFTLDGTAQSYTVPAWTAAFGTLDCATDLAYVWTIPAALTAFVTTSTTSRTFSMTSSDNTLATSTGHTITLTATTSSGGAIASGNVATFTLLATAVTSAGEAAIQNVVQISTIIATTAVTAITGVQAATSGASRSLTTGGANSFDATSNGASA